MDEKKGRKCSVKKGLAGVKNLRRLLVLALALTCTCCALGLWYVVLPAATPYLPDSSRLRFLTAPPAANDSGVLSDAHVTRAPAPPVKSPHSTLLLTTSTTRVAPCSGRLICHHFEERLGNCLFQYASLLGLSWSLNRTAVFSGKPELDHILALPPRRFSGGQDLEKRCSAAKRVFEKSCYKFDEDLLKLDPCLDYHVGSYLQSWRYFDQFRSQIREAVNFSRSIREEAQGIIKGVRAKYGNATLIGLHVRRGDFERQAHVIAGYPMAGPEYINRSMTYFECRFPDSVFLVVSENTEWCKAHVPPGKRVVFLDVHAAPVDLCMLTFTDHVITTFGSYSWWAGYLNPGITVYMKDFIKPDTRIGKLFNRNGEDFIYPGWIPL